MAGLPCEACQEPMTVIPGGVVVTDAAGRAVYRRCRVCVTPGCEMYLLRRATFEVAAPLSPSVEVMRPDYSQIRRLNLAPRAAPAPDPLGLSERG